VVEFGEWLCTQVLKSVPHRQWIFCIPKRLRIYFLFNRKLLAKLSRCACKGLGTYLNQAVPFDDAMPGPVIAAQTFGDFQKFNSHLHLIALKDKYRYRLKLIIFELNAKTNCCFSKSEKNKYTTAAGLILPTTN
jgi:hypothetical protein